MKDGFHLIHLDTSDPRNLSNIGKLDILNILLAIKQFSKFALILIKKHPRIVYLPICQTVIGYLRDVIYILIARLLGTHIIIHLHGGYFHELYEKSNILVKFIIRYSLKFISRAIVLGDNLTYIFEGLLPSRSIAVVPNGIPRDYITEFEFFDV